MAYDHERRKNMAGTVKVSFNMPEDEVDRLKKRAAAEGKTVTDLLLRSIRIDEKLDEEKSKGLERVIVADEDREREKELLLVG